MFRRKEESFEFESEEEMEAVEAASATATPASRPAPAASAAPATATPRPAAASSNPPSTSAAPRPATAAASSFRPAAPAAAPAARTPSAQSSAAPANVNTGSPASSPTMSTPAASSSAAPSPSKASKRILTVGNDILLKGEIATCDRLVIEGAVDAKLNDVHTVEIAESGSFKGKAQIEDAEISGLFDGELTVRGRLTIYSTGKVQGKISYGEIEIERGGQLSGEISLVGQATPAKQKEKAA